jgi:hypothetical protein
LGSALLAFHALHAWWWAAAGRFHRPPASHALPVPRASLAAFLACLLLHSGRPKTECQVLQQAQLTSSGAFLTGCWATSTPQTLGHSTATACILRAVAPKKKKKVWEIVLQLNLHYLFRAGTRYSASNFVTKGMRSIKGTLCACPSRGPWSRQTQASSALRGPAVALVLRGPARPQPGGRARSRSACAREPGNAPSGIAAAQSGGSREREEGGGAE